MVLALTHESIDTDLLSFRTSLPELPSLPPRLPLTRSSSRPNKLASEPKEGLLEVVVGLGGNVVVLQVLLAVEG
jgi:hypothetical protein